MKTVADINALERWIQREFGAKRNNSRPGEYIWDCPFCDTDKKHHDYTFNVKKQIGNCWRGQNEKCESGHNLATLVSLYYGVDFEKAKEFIKKSFDGGPILEKIRRKLSNTTRIEDFGLIEIDEPKIIWNMPHESQEISIPNTPGTRVALKWLTEKRKIPLEVVSLISPVWLPINVTNRWKKYNRRVLFPVRSDGNKGFLAYSTDDDDSSRAKTMNPPGSILSNMLFLYDLYRKSTKPIIICEGIFDALRLFIFGYNAVCVFGTGITSAQIQLLNQLSAEEVIVCLDANASGAGEGSLSKRADKMARKLRDEYFHYISIIRLLEKDPDDTEFELFKQFYDKREVIRGPVGDVKKLKRILRKVQEQ